MARSLSKGEHPVLTNNRLTLGLSLALCTGVFLEGCKAKSGGPEASAPVGKRAGSGALTKEEVGAILGVPVTGVEGTNTLTYKTATIFIKVSIVVEQDRDSVESMDGARKATAMLGGTVEAVPGLGDEAFFGAMSMLYVRKGDSFATIEAPNYQLEAQAKATEKFLTAAGSDEMKKAGEELQQVAKDNPIGPSGDGSMKDAIGVINATSKKQGTAYETRTRAVAVALATKLMEKL